MFLKDEDMDSSSTKPSRDLPVDAADEGSSTGSTDSPVVYRMSGGAQLANSQIITE